MAENFDLIIVGAGPAGLAVAIEAQKAGLRYIILEKGSLTNSIVRYPNEMTFFSTAPLLEIGGIPFSTPNARPTRAEGLSYYRAVTQHFDLNIRFREEVTAIVREERGFLVRSNTLELRAEAVVLATGYFDNPIYLNVPGENLPNVSHYYTEAHPFFKQRVTIIGSQNSSVEAALDLYAHGAQVTIVARAKDFGESVKYWIKPNLVNRVKARAIKAYFESNVTKFEPDRVEIRRADGTTEWIPTDFTFALTGYHPNVPLLESFGVTVAPLTHIPEFNPDTFETNIPNMFIAGSVACGCETGTIFIENGRLHAYTIIGVIKRRLADQKKTRVIE